MTTPNPNATWLDRLLNKVIDVGGVQQPSRGTIDFASGATVVDDPTNDTLHLNLIATPGANQITLDSSSASVSVGDWLCSAPTGSKAVKAVTAALVASGNILGMATQAGAPGATITYAAPGDVVPAVSVAELGSGRTSLVSITSTARSARAYAYGQATGGIVDSSGNLTILPVATSPGRVPKNAWIPETFQAVGDGSADDTTPIRNMLNAATVLSTVLPNFHFSRIYKITGTIVIAGISHGHFSGERGSQIVWGGGYDTSNIAPIPAFWLQGCQETVWENLTVYQNNSSLPLAEAWRVTSNGTYGISKLNCWINCDASFAEVGWRIGGEVDNNNDSNTWVNCQAYLPGRHGWEIQDSQSTNNTLVGCLQIGQMFIDTGDFDPVGITGGVTGNIAAASSSTVNFSPVGYFGPKDIGKVVEIYDDTGTLTRTTITACAAGSTHFTVAATIPNNVTNGHLTGLFHSGVNWGSQGMVYGATSFPLAGASGAGSGAGGAWTLLSGQTGGNIDADFVTDGSILGEIGIRGFSSEVSRRFLRSRGGATGDDTVAVHIDGCRCDPGSAALQAFPYIDFEDAGSLVISNSIVGLNNASPIVIRGGNAGISSAHGMFTLENTRISGTLDQVTDIFPATVPTFVGRNYVDSPSRSYSLAPYAVFDGGVSGTVHINLSFYDTHVINIAGNTTLVFDDPPDGLGGTCRLILLNNPGVVTTPYAVTWPTSPNFFWAGSEPAPFLEPRSPEGYSPVIVDLCFTKLASYPWGAGSLFVARVITPKRNAIALTLANGANHDLASQNAHGIRVTGPTGAYSIGGIVAPVLYAANPSYADGFEVVINSTVPQTLTITNEDASSTAINRITTGSGADIVCHATTPTQVTLRYDSATTRWLVTNVWPLP